MAEGSEEANNINLTVKTAKDKQQIEIGGDATVKEVRRATGGGGCACHACVMVRSRRFPGGVLPCFNLWASGGGHWDMYGWCLSESKG